jgi:hypothetical protein
MSVPFPQDDALVCDLHRTSQRRTRRQHRAGGGVPADRCKERREVMKKRAVLFGILMLAIALPLGAGERITLKVSPAVAFAPANLVVRATIPADADNRAVEIVAESDDFYRSSQIQLEGEKAAKTNTFEFRSLPPGLYEVRANLVGANGRARAVIRQQVNVLASGNDSGR